MATSPLDPNPGAGAPVEVNWASNMRFPELPAATTWPFGSTATPEALLPGRLVATAAPVSLKAKSVAPLETLKAATVRYDCWLTKLYPAVTRSPVLGEKAAALACDSVGGWSEIVTPTMLATLHLRAPTDDRLAASVDGAFAVPKATPATSILPRLSTVTPLNWPPWLSAAVPVQGSE